ncbi:hypothetical protein ACT17_22660 [Mycolicibacterium conceptionense]|uniref:Uncharacterized protein n=1 Tax=Mycolicibacterium conceptionense TaxID=451644 RepID=A0A0J8U2X5_9MYCO|nr:hypothetical protein [Mycolicibacterium conceptionense]KMV15908.1 hypothetical protein ACT17_22660 [Mycolicibacterium conceptionense]
MADNDDFVTVHVLMGFRIPPIDKHPNWMFDQCDDWHFALHEDDLPIGKFAAKGMHEETGAWRVPPDSWRHRRAIEDSAR